MTTKKNDVAILREAQSCINFQLRKTARSLGQFYDMALRPSGLRGNQFTMLVVIEATQPVSMSDLANHLVMDRSTLTRNFDVLEQQGLVATTIGKDRRSRLIRLTRKGRSTVMQALPYWQGAQRHVLAQIGEDELQALLSAANNLSRVTVT